jgi:hypothetical protein
VTALETDMPKTIYLIQSQASEFRALYYLVENAVANISKELSVVRLGDVASSARIIESLYQVLESADLVICDLGELNPNVLYELGYAHGRHKPVLLIAPRPDHVPFDVRAARTLFYEPNEMAPDFQLRLEHVIQEALDNPEAFSALPVPKESVNSVFISYSHRDSDFLERLMVHLKPLEKEGLIDLWVDTKLQAGDQWRTEIEKALARARVAVLLITADFLASDFIVDNELPPLLEKAESEGTRVIPVIVKPCRFARDKSLKRFQAVNNPNAPLATLPESQQELIYDKVSELIEGSIIR